MSKRIGNIKVTDMSKRPSKAFARLGRTPVDDAVARLVRFTLRAVGAYRLAARVA